MILSEVELDSSVRAFPTGAGITCESGSDSLGARVTHPHSARKSAQLLRTSRADTWGTASCLWPAACDAVSHDLTTSATPSSLIAQWNCSARGGAWPGARSVPRESRPDRDKRSAADLPDRRVTGVSEESRKEVTGSGSRCGVPGWRRNNLSLLRSLPHGEDPGPRTPRAVVPRLRRQASSGLTFAQFYAQITLVIGRGKGVRPGRYSRPDETRGGRIMLCQHENRRTALG